METMREASVRPFAEHDPSDLGTPESAGFSILTISLCNLSDFLSSDVLEFRGTDSGNITLGEAVEARSRGATMKAEEMQNPCTRRCEETCQ
jgi:hypothetical protein